MLILDGLPARHVGPQLTPVLAGLGADGAFTVGRSVMTSATYPNHASFITGVTPLEHGLVANWVHDGERPRPAHHVGPSVPTLFDACRRAGRHSVAVFGDQRLVGVMGARQADYHWPPDGRIPDAARRDRYDYVADDEVVEQLAGLWSGEWDLMVAHLNEPDTAGHIDGPDSDEASVAYTATDVALGRIVSGLAPVWEDLVLVVLSDHDQLGVDPAVAPIQLEPRPGLTAIPEGSAAVVWGQDPDRGAWLDRIDGVAGHEELRPGVRLVWATPGRVFALPAGFHAGAARGHHGGVETRDQVVVVSGGHARAAGLVGAVRNTTPGAEDWAPTIADLLGLDLPGAVGRSLLAARK